MKKLLGMAFATIMACVLFSGCSSDPDDEFPSDTGPLTSVEAVEKYLAQQDGTKPGNPIQLDVKIDAPNWQNLFLAIYNADKYIAIDLSQCTNAPPVFSGMGHCEKVVSLVLPPGINAIGGSACYNCKSLKQIDIPYSVTSIGNGAFSDCTSLAQIVLPANITEIGEQAFSGCTTLGEIALPAMLAIIGREAFYRCTALRQIDLPARLVSIGPRAFYLCSKLNFVICRAETPPELIRDISSPSGGHFDGTAGDFSIVVPT